MFKGARLMEQLFQIAIRLSIQSLDFLDDL
jgi:hypothetical protein